MSHDWIQLCQQTHKTERIDQKHTNRELLGGGAFVSAVTNHASPSHNPVIYPGLGDEPQF